MTNTLSHWDTIYQSKDHAKVSWHQDHSTLSFDWILKYTQKTDSIIDVGSGVSILADNLLDEGYVHLSLLELSPAAIQTTKDRLKAYAEKVNFYNAVVRIIVIKSRNFFLFYRFYFAFFFCPISNIF